jgi:tRNA(Arg) A34 adenosine deaminase TadA
MLSAGDKRWLQVALKQAEAAPHSQWRVGAAIVRGGSLLSVGHNRYRNSPSQVDLEGVSYHAEEVALRRAGDPEGGTIYVARITRSGKLGMARPCKQCQLRLLNSGIRYFVYTTAIDAVIERVELDRLQ